MGVNSGRSQSDNSELEITLPGAAQQLSLFCFAKKVTKKDEPAALLFIFVFLSPLFSLPPLL
jgi:uncharacterized paraquat-inducible protein A